MDKWESLCNVLDVSHGHVVYNIAFILVPHFDYCTQLGSNISRKARKLYNITPLYIKKSKSQIYR